MVSENTGKMDLYLENQDSGNKDHIGLEIYNGGSFPGAMLRTNDSGYGSEIEVNTNDTAYNTIPISGSRNLARMSAGTVYLNARNNLIYDVPTLSSFDCNNLGSKPGIWYLKDSSTNRPVNENGWLKSHKYSGGAYCYQEYITITGKKYYRMQDNGTWGAWYKDGNVIAPNFNRIKIAAGTTVVNCGSGATSANFITNAQLNSYFSVSNCSNGNVTVTVANGDGNATSLHFDGATYVGGWWYAVFNGALSKAQSVRINWTAVYFGG